MTDERFYVYRLMADDGAVMYVGKGSGRRLARQQVRFRLAGEVVARFKSEAKAYLHERECIAAMKPALNRHPGGNGSRAMVRRRGMTPKWLAEIKKIGTHAYAARVLLKYAYLFDASTLGALRQVAHG